jgi:acetoin utilization deacetylase AcuC-like enzyme
MEQEDDCRAGKCAGKDYQVAVFLDERCKEHITGYGHPEQPARIDAVKRGVESVDSVLSGGLGKFAFKPAPKDFVVHAHEVGYLGLVEKDIKAGREMLTTGDTNICNSSLDIALLSVGAAVQAVDTVFGERTPNRAFCGIRPPGHHASGGRGMGFCIFNNVAIAARYAQQKHGAGKVLVVDWDVHHGNGTQDIFYEDDSVFFFSTHQAPWYPGTGSKGETGSGKGLGTVINRPFPAGAGWKEIGGSFETDLLDAANRFKPDLVIISAGFDSRVEDPLGHFRLEDDDFANLTKLMLGIAAEHAGGRVVSVLEGGYNLEGLEQAVKAHVGALASSP